MASQARITPERERPRYAELLSEDIASPIESALTPPGAKMPAPSHYVGWETHHGKSQRFYVTGFGWLERACTTNNVSSMCKHTSGVLEIVAQTNWDQFTADWTEDFACKQIRRAREGKPLLFHKAVLVIAAAELFLASRIKAKKARATVVDAFEVYSSMKVKPAVWNIDEFNTAHIEALGDQKIRQLAYAVGESVDVLRDLAKGHTVTRATAEKIKATNDKLFFDRTVGLVRPWPGRKLGQRNASPNESPSLV